jgi:hypothetical protein
VIQIDPVVAPLPLSNDTSAQVHHVVVWSCSVPLTNEDMSYNGTCVDHMAIPAGSLATLVTHCQPTYRAYHIYGVLTRSIGRQQIGIRRCIQEPFLAVWAMGGGSFVLPKQAGFPLNHNNTHSRQFFVMVSNQLYYLISFGCHSYLLHKFMYMHICMYMNEWIRG